MYRLFTLSIQKFFRSFMTSYKESEDYLIFANSFHVLLVQFWANVRT